MHARDVTLTPEMNKSVAEKRQADIAKRLADLARKQDAELRAKINTEQFPKPI